MHKCERIVAFTVCFAIIISMTTTVFAKESADDKSTEVYEMTTNDNVNPNKGKPKYQQWQFLLNSFLNFIIITLLF